MAQCHNATTGEAGFDDTINVCLGVSLVISLIGNGFVCFIVARHYQLHTVTNACIVNMAVGQLFLALICVPSFLEILASSPHHSRWLCTFHRVGFIFFGAVVCFAFLLMAAERHVVISTAGRRKLTHGKTTKLILSSWVLAAIYAVPWAIIESDRQIICERRSSEVLPPAYLTCMPLLLLPQSKASQVLNRLSLLLYFLLPMILTAGTFVLQCKPLWRGFSAVRPLGAGHPRSIRYLAEIKTTRTMLVIATLFLAAWMPYCAVSLRNAFDETSSSAFNGSTYAAVLCLAYLSTCSNPLVYALRNPRFSSVMQGSRRRSRKIQVQFVLQGQHSFTSVESQPTRIKAHGSTIVDTSRSEETQTTSS